jgi:hypothetical protein
MQRDGGNGKRRGAILGGVGLVALGLVTYALQRPLDWVLDRVMPNVKASSTPSPVPSPTVSQKPGVATPSSPTMPSGSPEHLWLRVVFDAAGAGVARDRAIRLNSGLAQRIEAGAATNGLLAVEGQVVTAANGMAGSGHVGYRLQLRRTDGVLIDCGLDSVSFQTDAALFANVSSRIVNSLQTFKTTGGKAC